MMLGDIEGSVSPRLTVVGDMGVNLSNVIFTFSPLLSSETVCRLRSVYVCVCVEGLSPTLGETQRAQSWGKLSLTWKIQFIWLRSPK